MLIVAQAKQRISRADKKHFFSSLNGLISVNNSYYANMESNV